MQPDEKIPVLLVDDRPKNLTAIEALLDDMGLELVRAGSGNEALSHSLKVDFALVLMDVQMPEMDGFETAELMRSNPRTRRIPIIFVTAGMNDIRYQFKGYSLGAVDYLVKPIEPAFLRSKVSVFCDLYRQRRQIEFYSRNLKELVDRQTNELLAANDELLKFSYAVQQSPTSIVITDTEGNIQFVNQQFARLSGYSATEAVGQNMRMMKSENTHSSVYNKLWQTITSGEVWRGEFCNKKKDGSLFWEQAIVFPVKNTSGITTHYMGIKEDITERRGLEQQLLQSQKMEAIGTLAGGVAHDFNNILTVIMGYASLIKMNVAVDSKVASLAGEIVGSVERAAELAQSLLTFSRKRESILQPLSIKDLISGLHKSLKRLIREDIQLELQLCRESLTTQADRNQLEQVVINLVVNARDAIPSAGKLLIATEEVLLAAGGLGNGEPAMAGRYALITVADNGAGMDEYTRQRIFEPFFTTKEVGKGTGLGLSMAYGIIKKHLGYIYVTSQPGQGASFHIYMPLVEIKPVKSSTGSASNIPGGSEAILLVEDDRSIRQMNKMLLEMHGYKVFSAEDGKEGLQVFQQHVTDIDLILSDIIMPRISGVDMYAEIVKVKPDLPVIFMSGYSTSVPKKGNGERLPFLNKPLRPDVLLRKIREILDEKSI